MRIVVADASPLNYLILAGVEGTLPKLFSKVILPREVHGELRHPKAPVPVRHWAEQPPEWIEIKDVQGKDWRLAQAAPG